MTRCPLSRKPASPRSTSRTTRGPPAVLLDRRSPLLPDVPTIDEAGVPREIVERLNKEVNALLKRKDVLDKLQSYGYAAEGSTPERLLEINRADLELWRRLVKEAGIPLD